MTSLARVLPLWCGIALVGVLLADGVRSLVEDAPAESAPQKANASSESGGPAPTNPSQLETSSKDSAAKDELPEAQGEEDGEKAGNVDGEDDRETDAVTAGESGDEAMAEDADLNDGVALDPGTAESQPDVEVTSLVHGAVDPATLSPSDAGASPFPGKRLAKGPWVVARSTLSERLNSLLADKKLAGAKISVAVVSAADGAVLFQKDADAALIVASNNKVFTTAAAIRVLTPNFSFKTRVYSTGAFADGAVLGDLVVVGDGDPDVMNATPTEKASLAGRIAAALLAAGVKRVSGDVVIDDHVFDRQFLPPQWKKDQLAHDYAAPVAGFSLYENCLVVRVKPASKVGALASVDLLPKTSVLDDEVTLKTGSAKGKNSIVVPAPVAVGKVKISGQTPHGSSPVPLYLPLANPSATHPAALRDALIRAGIAIGGKARLADAKLDVKTMRSLATVESSLESVLHKLNKESSNVLAEHVYKRIGAAAYGSGTFQNAGKAVLETLRHYGIDATGAASADGSGLSRGNTFSARQTALVLRAMWQSPARAMVVDSLPISGVDGTLRKRLTQNAYKGRVRAKTGYIAGVSTLSGYAATDSNEVLCFSILVNGVKGSTAAKGVQDAIAKVLVDLGPKPQ